MFQLGLQDVSLTAKPLEAKRANRGVLLWRDNRLQYRADTIILGEAEHFENSQQKTALGRHRLVLNFFFFFFREHVKSIRAGCGHSGSHIRLVSPRTSTPKPTTISS